MANADVVATGSLQLSTTIDNTSLNQAVNKSVAQIQQSLSSVDTSVGKIQTSFNKGLGGAIDGVTSAVKLFGTAAVAAIGGTLGKAVQLGLEFNGAEQQIRKSFTSLLGGSQQATDLLGKLKNVAGTAFPVGTINEAALGLVKVGVSAQNIIPLLNTVTQAVKNVGGTAQDVTQISNALERVETTGKFTSRTLLALSSTGVNAAQLIGDAMGKTADQIRVEISKGAISGQQALEQLAIGVQKNTAKAIANTVETAKGARSAFTNALTGLGGELTKAFVNPEGGGAEAKIFDDLTVVITKLKSVSGPVVELVQKLADGLVKAADSAKTFISQLSVDQVKKFVDEIEKFAPFVLAAAGAFTGFTTKLAGGIPVIGDLVTKLNPVAGGLLGLALAIPGVRDLFTQLIGTLSVGLKPAFEELQKALPPLLDAISKLAKDVAPAFIGFAASAAPLLVAAAKAADLLATALGPLLKLLDFGPVTVLLELFLAKLAIGSVTGSNTFKAIENSITGVISKLKEGTTAGSAFSSSLTGGGAVVAAPTAAAGGEAGAAEGAAAAATSAAAGKAALQDLATNLSGGTQELDKLGEAAGRVTQKFKDTAAAGKIIKDTQDGVANSTKKLSEGLAQNRDAQGRFTKGFDGITASEAAAAKEAETVVASTGKLSGALSAVGNVGKTAFAGVLEGLGSLLNPVNLVITGIGIIANRLAGLKAKAAESAGQFASKIDFSNLTDPSQITSQADAASAALKAAETKLKKDTAGINGLNIGGFRITPTVDINKEQANIDALKKALTGLQGIGHDVSSVFNQVGSLTGKSFADIGAKAQELGIDFKNIKPGDIQPDVDKLVAALGGMATTIQGVVVPSLKNLQAELDDAAKTISGLASASDAVTNANEAVTSANNNLANATQQLKDIEKERAKILRDTTANARELKAAQDELLRLGIQQEQLDRDRIKTLATLKDLQDPATQADKQSQADEKVARAKIAVNQALQAQKDLQDAANKSTDEANKTTITGVNLAGLSLDQARAKLANVRATLAAQQQGATAGASTTAATAKTQQQIDDERLSKQLDVTDAQRALKDAVKEQGNVQKDINDQIVLQQEHLKELGIQQDQLDSSKIDAQNKLNDLKRGEFAQTQKLLDLDKQRKAALASVESAQRAVTKATEEAKTAALNLRLEEDKISMDAGAVAQDQLNINNAKLSALKNIDPAILASLKAQGAQIQTNLNLLNQQQNASNAAAAAPTINGALVTTINSLTDSINKLALTSQGSALQTQALLANRGINIPLLVNAEGSLVTKPSISHIGEGFKPELILPLTKPDRVWELVSQHLPKYPGALRAIESAIAPSMEFSSAASSLRRSGATAFVARGEGPMTYDQAQEMIQLLKDKPDASITVEAPIQVSGNYDEGLLARKLEQRILKSIMEKLR